MKGVQEAKDLVVKILENSNLDFATRAPQSVTKHKLTVDSSNGLALERTSIQFNDTLSEIRNAALIPKHQSYASPRISMKLAKIHGVAIG